MADNNNHSKNTDKKNKDDGNDDDLMNLIVAKMKGFWDYINNRKFWLGLGIFSGCFALKHLFFNRFVPISEINKQIENK